MRQRARVDYNNGIDDPFGSSFILPIDQSLALDGSAQQDPKTASITTDAVPLPYPDLNILLPDYQVDEIVFGYDNLDIHTIAADEAVAEPDYSTAEAIINLFGTSL
jgi:hypothetical protein